MPRIFEVMKEKGITATQLSSGTGISTGNISDWKKGKSSPSRTALIKVSNYLAVNPEYLEGRSDNKIQITESNITEEEKRVISLFREQSEEFRKSYVALLEANSQSKH